MARGAAVTTARICLWKTSAGATTMPPNIQIARALSHIARPREGPAPGERRWLPFLVETDQQQHSAKEQKMLQRNGTPVETNGQQVK